jgi:hypothetical protein
VFTGSWRPDWPVVGVEDVAAVAIVPIDCLLVVDGRVVLGMVAQPVPHYRRRTEISQMDMAAQIFSGADPH